MIPGEGRAGGGGGGGGGRGVLRISSNSDDGGIFGGLKVLISRLFIYVGIFWGYTNLIFLFFVLSYLMLSGYFYGSELFRLGIFLVHGFFRVWFEA